MPKPKMYLENYWLLFLEFIDLFGQLTYKNIPLPLLANFYQLLDDDLKEEMMKSEFKKHLKTKKLKNAEIQPRFEKWLKPLKQPLKAKSIEGKILLNQRYLRFSKNNYIKYFDPNQTIVFMQGAKKDKYMNIPVHNMKDYIVEVKDLANEFIKRAKTIFASVNKHRVFNDEFFRNKFITLIPKMVQGIAAVDRYFEKNPISCVVVGTTEDLISRILTIVSAKKGIPSICMQHGLLTGEEAFLPIFSTKVAAYGQYEKDIFIKKGVSEKQIVIVGHPRFDGIFNEGHMSKREFHKKYKLNSKKKIILIATQPTAPLLWNELIETLAQEPEIEIVIKPHPLEIIRKLTENYRNFENKYKSVKFISERSVNLYDILANVDAVVVKSSTVGLETMLFNKPLCILNNDKLFNYYDKLGDHIYSDPTKLVQFIAKLVKDTKLKQMIQNKQELFLAYAYPQKLSGVRLIREIDQLTGYKGK
ncbi:CDP-glycerol glycerophosphotransferase family protein [Crassaminicella profunda]|uniref:capsular polysaccharide export protein, LipB/KpsS family n=1 Tax=Crassaminicella profunda TaxID=1286698 RepID=UPI001CA6CC44|nr:UDP-N-acetylglucosamine 2-epimerase [Crassaminicella profunda]QZY56308.1 CDP-glycerol glycerophosphotransferase family protein [Crassaminicella profunda]